MEKINIHHAKKVAMSALALTSCGFILWLSQTSGQADNQQPTAVVQQQATQVITKQESVDSMDSQPSSQNIDQNDHGNYGYLDSAQINDQGQLEASGWHATNDSAGKNYHYIIAFDKTNNKEIGRQNITDTNAVIDRPDVQNIHNVAGASQSGFKISFDLSKAIANTDAVQLISRYSSDPNGNDNYVDYWFAPINVNRNNYAYLDDATAEDGNLVVSGWHATNLAADKPYHYIIIVDRNLGYEVARQEVTTKIARPDVAKIYTDIENSGESGFNVKFNLNDLNFNHQLQVISRYSSDPTGNSNYVDYYFTPITSGNYEDAFYLDNINLSDDQNIIISGWHANDVAQFENNHYLILYDNTANRQVAVTKAASNDRRDVAQVYPSISTAVQSGFSGSFDLSNAPLIGGHTYSIVSRYSTNSEGNGDNGYYTDHWSDPFTLNQHASYLDQVRMTDEGLQISGWVTSDYSGNYPYAYVIVLNDGHEVQRHSLNLTDRNDVAKAYSSILNSKHSGFNQLVQFDPALITGTMQVILRFSNDPMGNGSYDDQWSKGYDSNEGWFDTTNFDGSNVQLSGWHASDQSASKKYHWIIAVDQNGSELGRWQVMNTNLSRPDLATNKGYLLNSDHSGFNLNFAVTSNMQHKIIWLIDRLTDDANGNGNYIDYRSNGISINSGAQTNGLKTIYYDALGNIVGIFNNAEVICQNPELPTGCEMTAVTMMLRYAGVNVSKFDVANATPRSSNGNYGFVGNPYSPSGWWVFPTGIAPVVNQYLGTSQVMTGSSLQAIQAKLQEGHLVVVWMANMNGFVNHAITLTGYNSNGFYYNNPWTGQKEAMSYGEFYGHWNADAQRALSY